MAFYSSPWGLFLMLVVNPFANTTTGIADQVIQPQDWIPVLTGESLKLECRVTRGLPPGPVKWFLGTGPSRKQIYADKTYKASERITRQEESSDTDFTIILHNVTLKDAGTYYCVKQKKMTGGGDKDLESGHGTQVVVKASNSIGYILPILVCALLVLLFAAAIFAYRKKKRGWNCCTSSSETSLPESTETPNQVSGDKEIVYADLKDPKGLQRAKPSNPEECPEYATIRITQTVPWPSA